MKKLFLIDGMALIYRSYYAFINNPLSTKSGFPTSAIYGFLNSIIKILNEEKPDYISIALDAQKPTFRHSIFSDYKANRKKMPDDLRVQIPEIKQILSQINANVLINEGYEADDIIATVVKDVDAQDIEIYIVTGDKDIMQLVGKNVFVYNPGNKFSGPIIYDEKKVLEKWNVSPNKICDLLSIMGDSSDNIPGVKGIGPKTASKLIHQFGGVDNLLLKIEDISNERIRGLIKNQLKDIEMSNQLVRLKNDVNIQFDIKKTNVTDLTFNNAQDYFEKYEMSSLLSVMGLDSKNIDSIDTISKKYELILSMEHFFELKTKLENSSIVSFDLETTNIDPLKAEIVGISFSIAENEGYYIPILFPDQIDCNLDNEQVLLELKKVWNNPELSFIGQNIKYDSIVLSNIGIEVENIVFDTMLAAHLIDPSRNRYSLDDLCLQYLDYKKISIESVIGYKGNQINMSEVSVYDVKDYACEDADTVIQLYYKFNQILKDKKLIKLFEIIEVPFIKVLINLEKNGLFVDLDMLESISFKNKEKIDLISNNIYEISGKTFNINSPQQLAEVLFDDLSLKQVKKRSTAVEVLEFLKQFHPLPEIILEYRHLNKLQTTYLDGIPKFLNSKTSRIHTSFNQTVASTGRLSSTKPNFQNIPIRTTAGKEIRKAFKPQRDGWKLISADYSQIELRIMAHFSKEEALILAFNNNEDVHSRTASLVYDVHIDLVTSEQRRHAKIVNYGIMYGAGPFRMSQELNINMAKAKKIIDNYFETYSMVKEFIDKTISEAQKNGYVETYFGRKRNTSNLNSSNANIVNAEKRATVNMPIQGTASELIKVAMIDIYNEMRDRQLESKMILQVHDELIFEVPENEEALMMSLIKDKMENSIKLDVPIEVDCKSGFNWYEIH